MATPPQPTNERPTVVEDELKLLRDLRHGKRLGTALKPLAGFAVASSLAGILLAAGQIYALGFRAAWRFYRLWWASAPFVGPLAVIAFLMVPLAVHGIGKVAAVVGRHVLGERLSKSIGNHAPIIVVSAIMFGLIPAFIVWAGYSSALESNPILASKSNDIQGLSKSVSDQTKTLADLSLRGNSLLAQLTQTQRDLEKAKGQLASTLSSFDVQRQAAEQASADLAGLQARRDQIDLRIGELERILDGRNPITREDLRRSSNLGLLFGAIIGFATSLAATFAFRYLAGKRKSDLETSL
jgi:hypothetical protein